MSRARERRLRTAMGAEPRVVVTLRKSVSRPKTSCTRLRSAADQVAGTLLRALPSVSLRAVGSRSVEEGRASRGSITISTRQGSPKPSGASVGRPIGSFSARTAMPASSSATSPSDGIPRGHGSSFAYRTRSSLWRTAPAVATDSPARSTSPTALTRSPRRRPPVPCATTSPSTRRRAAGILTPPGSSRGPGPARSRIFEASR